jgi:hypothetical protein
MLMFFSNKIISHHYMPRAKKSAPPQELPEEDVPLSAEDLSEPEQAPPVPAPAKRRGGGDIHVARAKALEKIKERSEMQQKKKELERLQKEREKAFVEAELARLQGDIELLHLEKKRAGKKASEPKPRVPPSDFEESEEEAPPPRRPVRRRAAPKPAAAAAAAAPAPRPVDDTNRLVQAAYQRRMQSLREQMYRQVFSM